MAGTEAAGGPVPRVDPPVETTTTPPLADSSSPLDPGLLRECPLGGELWKELAVSVLPVSCGRPMLVVLPRALVPEECSRGSLSWVRFSSQPFLR